MLEQRWAWFSSADSLVASLTSNGLNCMELLFNPEKASAAAMNKYLSKSFP